MPAAGDGPQLFADHGRGAAADADVDLVEDQRRPRLGARQNRLQRQRDARKLAAGRDPRHRAWLLARIGGQQKLDLVDA